MIRTHVLAETPTSCDHLFLPPRGSAGTLSPETSHQVLKADRHCLGFLSLGTCGAGVAGLTNPRATTTIVWNRLVDQSVDTITSFATTWYHKYTALMIRVSVLVTPGSRSCPDDFPISGLPELTMLSRRTAPPAPRDSASDPPTFHPSARACRRKIAGHPLSKPISLDGLVHPVGAKIPYSLGC